MALRGWGKLDTFTLFPSFFSLSLCRRCRICFPDCITTSLERIQGLNFGGKVFKSAVFQINYKDILMLAWCRKHRNTKKTGYETLPHDIL